MSSCESYLSYVWGVWLSNVFWTIHKYKASSSTVNLTIYLSSYYIISADWYTGIMCYVCSLYKHSCQYCQILDTLLVQYKWLANFRYDYRSSRFEHSLSNEENLLCGNAHAKHHYNEIDYTNDIRIETMFENRKLYIIKFMYRSNAEGKFDGALNIFLFILHPKFNHLHITFKRTCIDKIRYIHWNHIPCVKVYALSSTFMDIQHYCRKREILEQVRLIKYFFHLYTEGKPFFNHLIYFDFFLLTYS